MEITELGLGLLDRGLRHAEDWRAIPPSASFPRVRVPVTDDEIEDDDGPETWPGLFA
jgi:hypothetical protein